MDAEKLKARVIEAKKEGKLNLSYLKLSELPLGLASQIRATLPQLQDIDLRGNALTDLPDEFSEMVSLRTVRLSFNKLTEIPKTLSELPRLERLEISGNLIQDLPPYTERFKTLKHLDLSGNTLTLLDDSVAKFVALESLNAENNSIEAITEDISDLTNLQLLDVSTNRLGQLPKTIGKLKRLESLDLSANSLVDIPLEIGFLPNLSHLEIRYNVFKEPFKSMSEEPLEKLTQFLRDEHERVKLEERQKLKPIPTKVGPFSEFKIRLDAPDELVEVVESAIHDEKFYPAESKPAEYRTSHSITAVGSKLLVFGGYVNSSSMKSDQLLYLDEMVFKWRELKTTGQAPSARDGHSTIYHPESQRLLVFGGVTSERKRTNELYVLDLNTLVWYRPICEGTMPAAREHAAVTISPDAKSMIVFGGHGNGTRYNDLHALDLGTFNWTQMPCAGAVPSPRQSCAICCTTLDMEVGQSINKRELLWIRGGRNNFVLEDVFLLDLNTLTWFEMNKFSSALRCPPAFGQTMQEYNGNLYLLGGNHERGGLIDHIYTLKYEIVGGHTAEALDVDDILRNLKGEYCMFKEELERNIYKSSFFSDNRICSVQCGSETVGYAKDAKDDLFWDIFRSIELESLTQIKAGMENMKALDSKDANVELFQSDMSRVPQSYKENSAKEQKIIRYALDYNKTFTELYPKRHQLLLLPLNECGIQKFICTTIRPTQLNYTDLYDLDNCAQFVANFLKYEPLPDYTKFPNYIPSPTTVVKWQAGDCFDMSILLASLLIGVGYNAYCVCGYAPEWIANNDQSKTVCPFINRKRAESQTRKDKLTKAFEDKGKGSPKYKVKQSKNLTSKYDEYEQRMKQESAKEAAEGAEEDGEAPKPKTTAPKARVARRLHCWVLVMAPQREIAQHVFVEPSTGTVYPSTESPYIGIEFMWDNDNFWANMQLTHTGEPVPAGETELDLMKEELWESFLNRDAMQQDQTTDAEAPDSAYSSAMPTSRSMAGSAMPTPGMPSSAAPTPLYRGDSQPKTPQPVAETEEISEESRFAADIPRSWCKDIQIAQDIFDLRCPKGSRTTRYHKCIHELFSMFGDTSRWDGMTERLSIFQDEAYEKVEETREYFSRRKDKLRERLTSALHQTNIEMFDEGASFGLKRLETKKGEYRLFEFHHGARLDGLTVRKEVFGKKIFEHFLDRDDHLVYRSVTYDDVSLDEQEDKENMLKIGEGRGNGSGPDNGKVEGAKQSEIPTLPFLKMTEKFARNHKVAASSDVFKRTYFIAADQIRLNFHFGEDRITASTRLYTKDGLTHITEVDPLKEKPTGAALLEEYQHLLLAERECSQAIRDVEREIRMILESRIKEEQNILLTTPYYDITRIKKEESDEEKQEEEEVEHDFLSPFLPSYINVRNLTREECFEVRDKCLKALKDRLIERANIIQARHDEETAALAKRQANFQRDRDQMSQEEEEEYEKACEESMFRIHILEQRLKRHEEQALQKYYELDGRLRNDARLVAMSGVTGMPGIEA